MAQRPVAGKGSPARRRALIPVALLLMALLVGCAGDATRPDARGAIGGSWITVQRGDTLGVIATRAKVPLVRLQRFNPGVKARHLAVGQRLLVPSTRERAPSGGPYRYQIRPGDTYSAIARRFHTEPGRIQAANPNLSPQQLRVGQLIQVPLRGAPRAASRSAGTGDSGASRPTPRPSRPSPGPVAASASGWPWPLADYRVVREFGQDARGTLQPMLLASAADGPARAVADGEVRFAGSMRQLGRVVIVHHADNLQSVYALCDALQVESGQRVTRGTPLCRIGRSGGERRELLFDLRHGGKPLDPRKVLR